MLAVISQQFSGPDLILLRIGLSGATHELGGGQKDPPLLPKICHTYPVMMKLGTVIP